MKCTSPHYVKGVGDKLLQVPCGHCLHCRIQHSREWSVRLLHELNYYERSSFVTLTYDDEHLPDNLELKKSELQNFFKLLRRDLPDRKIKYFACGEYGDKEKKYESVGCPKPHGRPHFHAIIFGVDQRDKDIIFENWQKCHYERLDVGTVTYDSCRYVADYIMKKYNGDKQKMEYGSIQPPFQLCSQGIGKRFAIDNKDYIKDNESFLIHGVRVGIPRYYLKVLDMKIDRFKENRLELIRSMSNLNLTENEDEFLKCFPIRHTFAEAVDEILRARGITKQRADTLTARLSLKDKGSL